MPNRKIQLPLTLHREMAVLDAYAGMVGVAHVFHGRFLNLPGVVGELIVAGETDPGFFGIDHKFTIGAGPLKDEAKVAAIRACADGFWVDYRRLSKGPAEAALVQREKLLRVIDSRLLDNPKIAVKAPRRTGGDNADIRRLQLEDQALRKLNHRNILRRYAWFQDPQLGPVLVTERVRAKSLDHIQQHRQEQRQGPLPLAAAAHIGYQLAQALTHAHAQGVSHGDLHPGNVLLEEASADDPRGARSKGLVKLTGFAADGPAGALALPYAAPEQVRGQGSSPATDVYQFGALFYSMVTGRLPYEAAGPDELREMIASVEDHPNRVHHFRPDVATKLEALIEGAREKSLEKRWPLPRVLEELTQLYSSRQFSLEDGPKGSIAEELLARVQTNLALRDFYRAVEAIDLVRDFVEGVSGPKLEEVRRKYDMLQQQAEPYREAVETVKRIQRQHIMPVDHLMEELYQRYGAGEPILSDEDKGVIRESDGDVVIVKRSMLDGILEHTAAAIRELGEIDPERVGDMHRKTVDRASSQEVACSDLAARLIKFGEDYLKDS